jgi:excisionase family DNA binding protein
MSFVDKKELAEKLKISKVTIDRLRKKGLPSYKLGTKVVFDYEEVEKWVKEDKQ